MKETIEHKDGRPSDDPLSGDHVAIEARLVRQFHLVLRDASQTLRFTEIVCAYTATLRAQGQPVERVIVRLKDVLRRAQVAPEYRDRVLEFGLIERIVENAVLRCIEHYFGAPHPSPSPESTDA